MRLIPLFICFILLALQHSFAQQITVTYQADSIPSIKEKGLYYIHPKTDISKGYHIASLTITAPDINSILAQLQQSALDYGSNAFVYNGKNRKDNQISITVDLYKVSSSIINDSKAHQPTNIIYLFGDTTKKHRVKINGTKVTILANQIYAYDIPERTTVKINKGGFTGMTIMHKWQPNQETISYALGSGRISSHPMSHQGIGFSINTGYIYKLKNDFAHLIIQLQEAPIQKISAY